MNKKSSQKSPSPANELARARKEIKALKRRAEIEAALERVRSGAMAMAMQHSSELEDVSAVFNEQLKQLGTHTEFSYLWLVDEPQQKHTFWATWPDRTRETGYRSSSTTYDLDEEDPYTKTCLVAWRSGEAVHVTPVPVEGVAPFFAAWETLFQKGQASSLRPENFREGLVYTDAYMKYGSLGVITRKEPSPEEREILKRFSVEFERTYTRFLDLKQAEAQAREAQIEAALERVRSRTMAMHKSDELLETATVLYQELLELGIRPFSCGFTHIDAETATGETWLTRADGTIIPEAAVFPYTTEQPPFPEIYEAWQAQEPFLRIELEGDVLAASNEYVTKHTEIPLADLQASFAGPLPDRMVFHCAFYIHGYILVMTPEAISAESEDILHRFARVFDLAYRRFLDLKQAEEQAREAQIEAALERVRSRAMAMHQSDELAEASTVVFEQLQLLGIRPQRCGFVIASDDASSIDVWGTASDGEKWETYRLGTIPMARHPALVQARDEWQAGKAGFMLTIKGKSLKRYYELISASTVLSPSVVEHVLATTSVEYHYNATFKQGTISAIFHEPPKEAVQLVLQRFARAFEQTYTRFLDLKQAEKQAREAQIEAALERVRSRTMGMHQSGELLETVKLMYEQLDLLGLTASATDVEICIIEEETGVATVWTTDLSFSGSENTLELPFSKAPVLDREYQAWQEAPRARRKELFFVHEWTREELDHFLSYVEALPGWGPVAEELRAGGITHWFIHNAYFSHGMLTVQGTDRLDDDSQTLLKRFARVFEQTYTRFLDLRQAEAQAREAQIEAALERVRSRSMGMQSSDELTSVAEVCFEQFIGLEIPALRRIAIHVINPEEDTMSFWASAAGDQPGVHRVTVPMRANPKIREVTKRWLAHEDQFSVSFKGQALKNYVAHITKHGWKYPAGERPSDRLVFNCVSYSHGVMNTITYEPLADEDFDVLARFTKVFEQTYRRFLDLKQAEDQAREAQIETTLERVRAATMAMHSTKDLAGAAQVLFDQLRFLDVMNVGWAWFCILAANEHDLETWYTDVDGEFNPHPIQQKLSDSAVLKKFGGAWKKGEPTATFEYRGKSLRTYIDTLAKDPTFKKSKGYKTLQKNIDGCLTVTGGILKYGFLGFSSFQPRTAEVLELMERFAKVFEQTYTRFLDLQKAEAQAREAQIEAALERVRARTMAMHKSEELADAASVLFQQLAALGIEPAVCGFTILNHENYMGDLYFSVKGKVFPQKTSFPHDLTRNTRKIYNEWKKGNDFLTTVMEGKRQEQENQKLDAYWKAQGVELFSDLTEFFDEHGIAEMRKKQVVHYAYFSHGFLHFSHHKHVAEVEVLKRFAKVFDQTYTRFLDLQKAEAQAREAQIEAAMERIRSRSIAMRSSNELKDVIVELRRQIDSLGQLDLEGSVIHLYPEGADMFESFAAVRPPGESGDIVVANVFFPVDATELIKRMIEMYHSDQSEYTIQFDKAAAEEWQEVMIEHAPMIAERRVDFVENRRITDNPEFWNFADFSHGSLLLVTHSPASKDTYEMLRKAAQVFDQAYTRFLDLQKAEAQAREAQIEASLERVRARTMAMHNSDELRQTVAVVFEEMQRLGFESGLCMIIIYDKETLGGEFWQSGQAQAVLPESYHVPYLDHPIYKGILKAWQQRVPYQVTELSGALKRSYDRLFFEKTDFKNLPNAAKAAMMGLQKCFLSDAYMSHGLLQAVGLEPLPDDKARILQRFAKVIDLTYTRFLDLQQAEEQAREAQIEAALERVRARAMGMHHSDELFEAAAVLFQELAGLGIVPWRLGFAIVDEETDSAKTFLTTASGQINLIRGIMPLSEHPTLKKAYAAWKAREPLFSFTTSGKELTEIIQYLLTQSSVSLPEWEPGAKAKLPKRLVHNYFNFSRGFVVCNIPDPLEPESMAILQRFTKVFDMTYRRVEDLQQAEARAREAEQQASLDRVRAEIASMRTAADLQHITPLIWRELTTLGVPFFRCGVFIIDEATEHAHAYLSTPSGESLAALHLKFDSTDLIKAAVRHWRKQLAYCTEWDREQFLSWTQSLVEQGFIESSKQYQGGEEAPEKLVLQLVPFNQGMLYVGSATPLAVAEIDVVGALAESFAVAYARYDDFQRLEEAKSEVETALSKSDALSKELEVKNVVLEKENERRARELEEARQLQLSMLPTGVPKVPDLDIAVYMKTATEVGGDYYDFHLAKDGTLTVVVGDATGHGLKAGTMVTAAKSLFSSLAERPDIASTFRHMSQSIKSMRLPLLAMCLTMLKIKDGKMKLSSAGIPPTLIYRNASKKLEEVSVNGMPLGAMAGFPYREKEVVIKSGDTILLMSDGFPERMNDKERILDYRRAHQAFKKAAVESPKKIIKHLVKTGDEWANGRPQDDDVTFVVIKCRN